MQLGISSFTYGWAANYRQLGEQRLIDEALRYGVRLVQFGDNLPLHALSPDRLTALKNRADREGVTLEVGARGMTPDHLHHYIDLTASLDARLLRFVVDQGAYEPGQDELTALLTDTVPLLQQHGITLGIENHDRLRAAELAELMERVGSPLVGICLDSVNSMGAGEGLAEVVRTLAPYTVNLHIKDFGIQRLPHLMGFRTDGRVAGQGMLNIPWLVGEVAAFGRCRTAVLEQWVVPEADKATTVTKEASWADESMVYLLRTGLFTNVFPESFLTDTNA